MNLSLNKLMKVYTLKKHGDPHPMAGQPTVLRDYLLENNPTSF